MSSWFVQSPRTPLVMGSITMSEDDLMKLRRIRVGVCKCGHMWIMHFHNNNPARPGTSCDEWRCKCRRYRLRRLRELGRYRYKRGRQRRPERPYY